MSAARTYLDYNATAPLRPEARVALVAALDAVGNPSSVHSEGRAARAIVEDAREKVAALVGARPADVVFTSGATEANNWVLRRAWRTVLIADIEHPSVRASCLASDGHVVRLPVAVGGSVDAEAAAALLAGAASAAQGLRGGLLALQAANNETGVVQPLAALAGLARGHGAQVFTDAVQAAGRIPLDVEDLGIDYLSLSAHKIGGPKGIGALVVRAAAGGLPPLLLGGGQERRRRGGTENVAAIAGFGAAAEAALRDLGDMRRVRAMRDRLEREVLRTSPHAVIVGAEAERLPNTACIACRGLRSETLVIKLDLAGVAVSAGAACSSGKVGASHVLEVMGVEPGLAASAIRVSLGYGTTERDIDAFLAAWAHVAGRTAANHGLHRSARPSAISAGAVAMAGDN
jgi:cysteine desulfurase